MTKSCLVAKLSHYIALTDEETALLARLEENSRRYRRRQTVLALGGPFDEVFVVKSGWIVGHVSHQDGRELVAEIACPGDVVGVGQLAFFQSALTYTAATDVELCPFPKGGLTPLFKDHPRLIALLFAFTTLERATMIDRMRAMGHMNARDSLAMFLLQTRARLRVTGHAEHAWFEIPLSQEIIGHAVGLSVVAVNRALRMLEKQGQIERDRRMVRILDPDRLGAMVEFNDRHYTIDSTWLPGMK